MKIIRSERFDGELLEILFFIAKSSPANAKQFKSDLITKVKTISNNPLRNRKSECFDDVNIRDYIFKGYTIPYLIDQEKSVIVILGIYNRNIWKV